MTLDGQQKIVLAFSVPLALFVIIVSYAGLFIPDTYAKETANWQAQALAQDLFDLFVVIPLLLITSWFAYKSNRIALLLWSGIVVYLIYTFVLFCFAVHFNYLFIIYCLTLGLSFYAFLYFLFSQLKEPVVNWYTENVPVKTVGYFFIALSGIFYLLWFSEIIPAILNNTTPKTITDAGLITNPVHVLDLSVLLPGLIFIAVLLLKKKPLGLLLAPVVLTFTVLMDIAIGTMVFVMNMEGIETDFSGTIVMAIMALFSLILLIWYLKSMKVNNI
jgi:hypothetical protein